MSTPTALLKVMIDAARKAGRGLARDFGELGELQVSKKGVGDYVSAADLKAEQVVIEELTKARPGYGFLCEESGLTEGSDKTHTWIVDPLDGTTNFLHAIPHFAVNIALKRGDMIVAAVTRRMPAAMSQGRRERSQKPSRRPAATQARSRAAEPKRRTPDTRWLTWCSSLRNTAWPGRPAKGMPVPSTQSTSWVRAATRRRLSLRKAPLPRSDQKMSLLAGL